MGNRIALHRVFAATPENIPDLTTSLFNAG